MDEKYGDKEIPGIVMGMDNEYLRISWTFYEFCIFFRQSLAKFWHSNSFYRLPCQSDRYVPIISECLRIKDKSIMGVLNLRDVTLFFHLFMLRRVKMFRLVYLLLIYINQNAHNALSL